MEAFSPNIQAQRRLSNARNSAVTPPPNQLNSLRPQKDSKSEEVGDVTNITNKKETEAEQSKRTKDIVNTKGKQIEIGMNSSSNAFGDEDISNDGDVKQSEPSPKATKKYTVPEQKEARRQRILPDLYKDLYKESNKSVDDLHKELTELLNIGQNNEGVNNDSAVKAMYKAWKELVKNGYNLPIVDVESFSWMDPNSLSGDRALNFRLQQIFYSLISKRLRDYEVIDMPNSVSEIQQEHVDQLNEAKGLAINNREELRAMFPQLIFADIYIRNGRDVEPQLLRYQLREGAFGQKREDGKKSGNPKVPSTVHMTRASASISKKGLVMIGNPHGEDMAPSWVTAEVIDEVNVSETDEKTEATEGEKNVVFYEAPYALNLHEDVAKAVDGWLRGGANTPFSKQMGHTLIDAQQKGWRIMPIDASSVVNSGDLDRETLVQSEVPAAGDFRDYEAFNDSIPRINYMARNVRSGMETNRSKGGLVILGSSHYGQVKGGGLGTILTGSEEIGKAKKLTRKHNYRIIPREEMRTIDELAYQEVDTYYDAKGNRRPKAEKKGHSSAASKDKAQSRKGKKVEEDLNQITTNNKGKLKSRSSKKL